MASAFCEDCQQVVPIVPTGERIGSTGSARWWRLAYHPINVAETTASGIIVEIQCPGTGKKV